MPTIEDLGMRGASSVLDKRSQLVFLNLLKICFSAPAHLLIPNLTVAS